MGASDIPKKELWILLPATPKGESLSQGTGCFLDIFVLWALFL